MQTSRFLDPAGLAFFREVFEIAQRVFTATAGIERDRQAVEAAQENELKALKCERLLDELADEPKRPAKSCD